MVLLSILERSMTRKMQKKEIRSFVYKRRKEMPEREWREETERITKRVLESRTEVRPVENITRSLTEMYEKTDTF